MQMPDLDNDIEMAKQLSLFAELEKKAVSNVNPYDFNYNLDPMGDPDRSPDVITQLGRPPLISKASLNLDIDEELEIAPDESSEEIIEDNVITALGSIPDGNFAFLSA